MLFIDCHVHTHYSFDSVMSIDSIIKTARKRGLGGVIITDHDVYSYEKIKNKITIPIDDFLIIPGMEIKTDMGDVIAIMITEEIKDRNYYEVLDNIRNQGGLSILPHPFRRKKEINIKELAERVDWLEIFNSRSTDEQNENSIKLNRLLKKPITAGSDAHISTEIGRARIGIKDGSTIDGVIKEISKKNVSFSGVQSSRRVHYASSFIGALKTGNYCAFAKGAIREIRGHS